MFLILSYVVAGFVSFYLIKHIIKQNIQKKIKLEEAKKKLRVIENIKKKIKRIKNLK